MEGQQREGERGAHQPLCFPHCPLRGKRVAFKVYGHPAPRGGGVKWIRASDTLITL